MSSEAKSLDHDEGNMDSSADTVTLNVGGTLFQTTWNTLLLAGKVCVIYMSAIR
jgi:hypothetical protein